MDFLFFSLAQSSSRHAKTLLVQPLPYFEAFGPSHPSVSPGDSVFSRCYLDAALALDTEARSSFITYAPSSPSFYFTNPIRGFIPLHSLRLLKKYTRNGIKALEILYWRLDLLKHKYIAPRFLAQVSYEQAAQTRVSPTPGVVILVFMRFHGVAPGDCR